MIAAARRQSTKGSAPRRSTDEALDKLAHEVGGYGGGYGYSGGLTTASHQQKAVSATPAAPAVASTAMPVLTPGPTSS